MHVITILHTFRMHVEWAQIPRWAIFSSRCHNNHSLLGHRVSADRAAHCGCHDISSNAIPGMLLYLNVSSTLWLSLYTWCGWSFDELVILSVHVRRLGCSLYMVYVVEKRNFNIVHSSPLRNSIFPEVRSEPRYSLYYAHDVSRVVLVKTGVLCALFFLASHRAPQIVWL